MDYTEQGGTVATTSNVLQFIPRPPTATGGSGGDGKPVNTYIPGFYEENMRKNEKKKEKQDEQRKKDNLTVLNNYRIGRNKSS